MTENTKAQPGSGDAAVEEAKLAPRNDAEAEQQEAAKQAEQDAKADKTKLTEDEEGKKRNRTKQYIERLQGDNGTLRAENEKLLKRLEAIESRLSSNEPRAPSPDDFYNDPIAYTQAQAKHAAQQARAEWERQQEELAKRQSELQTWNVYAQRAQAFAAENPDFQEVVGAMRIPLSPELQAAIAAHESGPAIAYHVGLNEQDAFTLAMTPAHLVPFAVEQIASRLKAAPDSAIAPPPSPAAAPAEPQKPISQAPAPAPRVAGRSPTEIPPEKLTDDEWYRRDVERRRKR